MPQSLSCSFSLCQMHRNSFFLSFSFISHSNNMYYFSVLFQHILYLYNTHSTHINKKSLLILTQNYFHFQIFFKYRVLCQCMDSKIFTFTSKAKYLNTRRTFILPFFSLFINLVIWICVFVGLCVDRSLFAASRFEFILISDF